MKDVKRSKRARQIYFDVTVKIKEIKDCISGDNEPKVIKVLLGLGYKLGKDFVRQHPIGERFVIDIAFINEQVAIEVDGASHNIKKQKIKDRKRDNYLWENNWVSIRIKDKEFFGYKGSFYKSLIKQIVQERRRQWEKGKLFPIDIPNFIDEDYE